MNGNLFTSLKPASQSESQSGSQTAINGRSTDVYLTIVEDFWAEFNFITGARWWLSDAFEDRKLNQVSERCVLNFNELLSSFKL